MIDSISMGRWEKKIFCAGAVEEPYVRTLVERTTSTLSKRTLFDPTNVTQAQVQVQVGFRH